MENQNKFATSKDVIAFLAQTFPQCFSLAGEAKPLKIGIFQDLSERLKDNEEVSKTLLRSSLRHYTNSWRYLHSVKEGIYRIGLDGEQDEIITKEHAEHAEQKLVESKKKAADKRREANAVKESEQNKEGKPAKSFKKFPSKSRPKKDVTSTKKTTGAPRIPPEKLNDDTLKIGTKVTVKVGKSPLPATITEIGKDGVQVQLDTGMSVKVSADSLRLAPKQR